MGFVTRGTETGLVLAEEAGDELRLSRALKQIDDRLVLQRHPGKVAGGFVYKVLRIVSEDHPAEYVTTWADEYGNPLPLSSGLIEKVKSRMLCARNQGVDADEYNAKLVADRQKTREMALAAVVETHAPGIERGRLSVAFGSGTGKRYYQRNHRPPSGAAA